MTKTAERQDWNPGAYARFHDLRLRPGIDLNAAVRLVAGQTIIAKNMVLIGEPKENLKLMVALAIDGIAV